MQEKVLKRRKNTLKVSKNDRILGGIYMDLSKIINQSCIRDELILAEIADITQQLIEIYHSTTLIADQQYIFSKLKEILQISREQELDGIHEIVQQAMREIMDV